MERDATVKQAANAFVTAALERSRTRTEADAAQERFEQALQQFFAALDAFLGDQQRSES